MTDYGKPLFVQGIICDIISNTDVSANGLAGWQGRFYGYGNPCIRFENGVMNFVFTAGGSYPYAPSVLRIKNSTDYSWFSPQVLQNCYLQAQFGEIVHGSNSVMFNDISGFHYMNTGDYVASPKEYMPSVDYTMPVCPCGASGVFNKMYSDGKLTILTYITSFPLEYDLWARVGIITPTGFATLSSGYVGHYLNAVDPVNLVPFSSFSLRSGYNFDQNGYLVGVDRTVNTALDCFVSGKVFVNNANMNCAGTGAIPTFNYVPNWYSSMRASWFAGTVAAAHAQSNVIGVSSIPRTFSTWNEYGSVNIFSDTECVELTGIGTTFINASVYNNKDGFVYTLEQDSLSHAPLRLIVSKPRSVVFLESFAKANAVPNGLVNFHRPVSILGAYKT